MVTIHERTIQWITNKRWSQYMKETSNGLLTKMVTIHERKIQWITNKRWSQYMKEPFNGLLTKDGHNTWKNQPMDY